MKISFVGLGKLGCGMFATLAKHHDIVGIDKNPELVKKLQKGIVPYTEKDLQEMLDINKERIRVTTDITKVAETDATFIMVPTPSDESGGFSSEYVEKAVLEVGRNIPDTKKYHLVVVCSTLIPGTMEEKIRPVLERSSNRTVGKDIGLCYNPEFMAIGNVIDDFINPDFVIIGETDEKAGKILEDIYSFKKLINYFASFHHMSLYNAELSKVANNAYVAMKMSFANTIGEICEGMPTGDAEKVLSALGSDTRIGKKYLNSGLSYGGPCFPRDSRAFTYSANKYGIRAHLSEMTDIVNIEHINRTVSKILQILSKEGTNKISVLGLTYKPDTMIVEESAASKIVKILMREGIKVRSYDPGALVTTAKSVKECLADAKVCFIATPWNEFKELKKYDFQVMKENPVIIDAWGIQNQLQHDKDIEYILLGKN